MNEKKRVFVATVFPDSVIKEIARIQEVLGSWKFQGKLTELENLHVTLKFLGEVDSVQLEKIKQALQGVRVQLFEAKLSEAGTFNFKGKPRLAWIKVGGKGIFELQEKVDLALKELFQKEERFMSHMTIARIKYVIDPKGFQKYVSGIGVKEVSFLVDRFLLLQSELKEHGPVYTVLEMYSLN